MFNPITVASAAKTAARAELRTKKVLSLTAKQYRLKQEVKDADKSAEATATRIARLKWETDQAASNGNPDATGIKERNDKSIDALTKEADGSTTRIAELKKEIAGFQGKIDAVTSGETKIDYDSILNLADAFIHEATKNAFASGEFEKEKAASESL